MKFATCPYCGKENISNSEKRCPSCGYEISFTFTKMKLEEDYKKEMNDNVKALEEYKSKYYKILIVAVLILFVLICPIFTIPYRVVDIVFFVDVAIWLFAIKYWVSIKGVEKRKSEIEMDIVSLKREEERLIDENRRMRSNIASYKARMIAKENREKLFDYAINYNFEMIKQLIEQGEHINQLDEHGSSLFTVFLKGYFNSEENTKEYVEIKKEHDECEYEFWNSFISIVQKTPLEERKSGIKEQMDWFLSKGANFNLCRMVSGDTETPLMHAVEKEDYYITKYLLENGADPKVWLFDEGFNHLKPYELYLIEHMDIVIMEGAKGERFENCLNIAALLAKYGIEDFGGVCIYVDKENRTVYADEPRYKY